MIRSKYSSLIGMVIAIILVFGLDQWLNKQDRLTRQNTDFQTYMIWIIVCGFALGVILYALSWLTLLQSQRSTPISIAFIIIGVIAFMYPILYLWAPSWISWLPLPYLYNFNDFSVLTGIFIAVLGFLHFSLPK